MKINDVKIIELTTHTDERGFFREIFRFSENFKNLIVEQLSHSLVNEGVIKAWHGHKYQSQWNYVISGEIKVCLYDNRKESNTHNKNMEFVVGIESNPIAYFFPPGVFHGYKCLSGPMNIIYATSGVYDLNDEIRKTSEELNINYNW